VNRQLDGLLKAVRGHGRPRVLFFVDLVQDIDVLLPVMLSMRSNTHIRPVVRVSRWLSEESPRTAALLERHRLPFRYVRRREVIAGAAPTMQGIRAVISASESTHPAHSAANALARRAKALGLRTYALQHGLENVGLFGLEARDALFASDVVFCWFPGAATPNELPAETRAKLAHVGRPAPPAGWRGAVDPSFDLGVFENLHWDRYDEEDRRRFKEGLIAVARATPESRILVRPHPAGGWADSLRHELAQFRNITPASTLQARRGADGAAEIMKGVRRVITTPSTVALDAALAGAPTALAAGGGDVYEPLPTLRSTEEWVAFATSGSYELSALDQFCARVLVAGDGASRIVERVSRDIAVTTPIAYG
jgi:hypothetical protein